MDIPLHPEPVTHAQLMGAAADNDVPTLRRYLKQGGNVDLVNADGDSALTVVTRAGHDDFLVQLLDASPRFDAHWGACAFESARVAGRNDLARRFDDAMRERLLPVSNDELLAAIGQGDMRAVRRCLARGDGASSFDGQLGPALLTACRLQRHGIASLLLSTGADLHFFEPGTRMSSLREAAGLGDARMVDLLLTHAAAEATRPLEPDDLWRSLLAAVDKHRPDVVARLLKTGPKSSHREAPPAGRALKSNTACTDPHAARATLQVLLDATCPADLAELRQYNQQTLLHHAALQGASWSIDTLIANGFAVDAVADNSGRGATPFISAVSNCKLECVRQLAAHGADLGRTNAAGQHALSIALSKATPPSLAPAGLRDVVACLLELGCDPDIPDPDGQTPRMRAVDHPELASLMNAHAARTVMRKTLAQVKPQQPAP